MSRNLHNLDKARAGIYAHALHTCCLVFLFILVVELIAMPMTLADLCHTAVCLAGTTSFSEQTIVCTQTHGATHLRDAFLLFHEVNDAGSGVGVHLRAVGIFVAKDVSCELYHHHLHTEAYAERRDVMGACVLCCYDLSFDAALPEARADDDARHAA